jgi:hypothetical protein
LADIPDVSDTESEEEWSPLVSPLDDSPVGPLGENGPANPGSYSRALQLIALLGQPFSALLLAQQPGGEYRRIASDQNIFAQVKHMTTIRDTIDVQLRTVEIL